MTGWGDAVMRRRRGMRGEVSWFFSPFAPVEVSFGGSWTSFFSSLPLSILIIIFNKNLRSPKTLCFRWAPSVRQCWWVANLNSSETKIAKLKMNSRCPVVEPGVQMGIGQHPQPQPKSQLLNSPTGLSWIWQRLGPHFRKSRKTSRVLVKQQGE